MIKAHMSEEEILAEATKRHNKEPFYTTLEGQVNFVREYSAYYDEMEEKALPLVDGYYQKFITGIDGKYWKKWEAQTFFRRVIQKEIHDTFMQKEKELRNRLGSFKLRDEKWKIFDEEQKKIAHEAEAQTTAALIALGRYAYENGVKLNFGISWNNAPEWESQMVSDLESKTEKDIM